MSLGGPHFSQYMEMAINYALSKNVLVVAAAGNEAIDAKNGYPSQKKEIIVVSAANIRNDIAMFSCYGETIDVCAPGEHIYSSVPGNKFEYFDGTSMAAPYVSAVSAMIKLEDKRRKIGEIESILKTYTDDIGTPGWDEAFGEGMVNVSAYSDEQPEFKLLSPTRDSICYDTLTVKYNTKNGIGGTIHFYIDDALKKSKRISADGVGKEILDMKGLGQSDSTLKIEYVSPSGLKQSDAVKVSRPPYNISFEVQDIEGKRIDYPLVYLYFIKGNGSGFIDVKDKKVVDGITYMNLDITGLLNKYDKIVAVASSDFYHDDDTKVPIYVKNIVSPGVKVLEPANIQAVRIYEELPLELESADRRKINFYGSKAFITPFVDGRYITMSFPIDKQFLFDEPFFIETGSHKLSIYTTFYESVVQLKGYGVNDYHFSQDCFTKVNIPAVEGTNGNYGDNSLAFDFRKRGASEICSFLTHASSEEKSKYVGDGNYSVSFGRTLNGNIVNFERYITLDSSKSKLLHLQVGGIIKNHYIIDYMSKDLKVSIYFVDSYGNFTNGFWIPGNQYPDFISPELVLKGKNKTYEGEPAFSDIPGILTTGFTFSKQKIPDGDYLLQTRLDKPFPIYDSKIIDMQVKIRNGKYYLENNTAPKVIKQPGRLVIDKYQTAELDMKKIFRDAEGDELFYKVNKGYIQDGRFYLETSNAGSQEIEITAMDYKGGSTKVKFTVLATDGSIIYLPDSGMSAVASLNGASSQLVSELLEAYRNKLTVSHLMSSYDKSITRKEFCELAVNFYKEVGKKELPALPANPFKDAKSSEVLKAYSAGIMKGITKDRFMPDEKLTRLQACEAMVGMIRKLKPSAIQNCTLDFSDAGKLSASARESMSICYQYGLIEFKTGNKIDPQGYLSREQTIAMMNRAFNLCVKGQK